MYQRLKTLFRDVAIYGIGDVATSAIGFLLLPLYTRLLSPADYGVIALLVTIEAGAKILLRWGVDSAFMRLYYECRDLESRQRLASTILLFLVVTNGLWLAAGLVAAPAICSALFGTRNLAPTLRLFLVHTYIAGFFFVPLHVLRIEGRAASFARITFPHALATIALRLALILGLRAGVVGFVLADLIVTVIFAGVLTRRVAPLVRLQFDRRVLGEALAFGLPRVPHGFGQQVISMADRYVLNALVSLRDVGIYSIGASLGLGLKLFLSAFEYAWAPFYLAAMRQPDAKNIYSRITTYVTAMLVLLAAALAAVASDLVRLMTAPEFYGASRVVPWIGVGVALQGFYQLTAIGLNITRRTIFQPVATATAVAASLALNLTLVPRFGMVGAAWAYAAAYGTLAIAGLAFSERVYPIRYEWRRLGLVCLAGAGAALAALLLVPRGLPALVALVIKGAVVVGAFPLLLYVTGFFRRGEIARFVEMRAALGPARALVPNTDETELAGGIVSTPSVVDGEASRGGEG